MKTLIVGDLQIDASDMLSERTRVTVATLSWLVQVAEQTQPELFVHLGDFGESNHGVDHYSLSLMCWFAAEIRKRVPLCYWLVGNHDHLTEDGSINLMSALAPVMEASGHKIIWPWGSGPEWTSFVSYLPEGSRERWRAEAGLVFTERENVTLFSHLPVTGALWRANGFEKDGLSPDWFPKYTFVGHYHTPNPPSQQQFATGHCIWYCGSPMAHDFRDNAYGLTPSQQLRGIWVADITAGQVTAMPTFLENPRCQYYLSFRCDEMDEKGNFRDEWLATQSVLPMERTHVRMSVPPGREKVAEDLAVMGWRAQSAVAMQNTVSPALQAHGVIDPHTDPLQAVQHYVDQVSDDALKGLDRETLKNMGDALLKQDYQLPVRL